MTRVKICGITNLEDALMVTGLGVEAVGFIFAASPRRVQPPEVAQIAKKLPPFMTRVGVFVNEKAETINQIVAECELNAAQLQGEETPEFCQKIRCPVIKAFRIKDKGSLQAIAQYQVAGYLLDTYSPEATGGTGKTFNWELAKEAQKYRRPIILAGGITPDNVADAIKIVHPYAVDVGSGVESSPGKKDRQKVQRLLAQAKGR